MKTVADLDAALTEPSAAVVRDLAELEGDLLVLGCAGKMGPTLTRLAQRASEQAGGKRQVIGVSRFSDGELRLGLEAAGIRTVAADLLDARQLADLPDAPNVIYMLGTKFGTSGQEHQTWATNAYLAGKVAERFAGARILVFSSGNVYPFMPAISGGASEDVSPDPVGEYAQSCLARERIFEHFSRSTGTPVTIFRLNYAIDLRYGVLLDIAQNVYERRPVDLTMGNVNVVWQGDACEYALRALTITDVPPALLNVTGPETISVRWLAAEFASRLDVEPLFEGTEAPHALLSNAAKAFRLFGYPRTTLGEMIDRTADWIRQGGPVLNKPTHFQERKGQF